LIGSGELEMRVIFLGFERRVTTDASLFVLAIEV
jgi:hypothetical protein